ncbi:MAG: HAD family hydrolase [Candidatus Sericytochromatia bacterium]|nr:HAD family hydrolase [Candidatus Sericytochromatia bacterium]
MTRAAVFLDRDGVINRATVRDGLPRAPRDVASLEVLPGVPEALTALRKAGHVLVVVTNQPDVARGTLTRASVEAIHEVLRATLPLDTILACFHDDADGCGCRKPRPGMLLEAARTHRIDLTRSHMVGDRWRDVEAGRRAGCRTYLVDHGYEEALPAPPDHRVGSLQEAASLILGRPV